MKTPVLIFFLFLSPLLTSNSFILAQNRSSIIGLRNSGMWYNLNIPDGGLRNYYELRFEPYYMYFPINGLGLGIMGEVEFSGGDMENIDYPQTVYGIGPISRYYYPFEIDRNFFRRIRFYGEASFVFSNYYQTDEKFVVVDNGDWRYSILRLRPLGMSFKLFKGLNFELSSTIYKYFPGRWRVGMNFGFEYHFLKNEKNE